MQQGHNVDAINRTLRMTFLFARERIIQSSVLENLCVINQLSPTTDALLHGCMAAWPHGCGVYPCADAESLDKDSLSHRNERPRHIYIKGQSGLQYPACT